MKPEQLLAIEHFWRNRPAPVYLYDRERGLINATTDVLALVEASPLAILEVELDVRCGYDQSLGAARSSQRQRMDREAAVGDDRVSVAARSRTGNADVVGVAWSVATYFVIPVIALEGLGPRDALRRSSALVREKWGELTDDDFKKAEGSAHCGRRVRNG